MSSVEIRPFQRADREQLTGLVNMHIGAVIPGVSVSVNTVMSQLEREPGEPVVDPWVLERRTLVAIDKEAVAAGALLLRYGNDDRVSDSYRDAAEIRWLIGRGEAADALMAACLNVIKGWGVGRCYADGSLPSIATYGVPDCWPHIQDLYRRAGFKPCRTEIILVARVDDLPGATLPPLDHLSLHRSVGNCGTRFSALLDGVEIGMVEVETDKTEGGNRSRYSRWADIGNFRVHEEHRAQGIGTWLLSEAAGWLRLGNIERLLAYATPEEEDKLAFLTRHGFRELVRTERGWSLE